MWAQGQGPQWTQWALTPSAYQNMSHEEVDWAALAQQWIKMKESHDVPPPPPPPPPPGEQEGGEAPMDVESKDDTESGSGGSSYPNWQGGWQQWGWGWNSSSAAKEEPPSAVAAAVTTPAYSSNFAATSYDYNHGNSGDQFQTYGQFNNSYWTSPEGANSNASFDRNSRGDWRRSRLGDATARPANQSDEEEEAAAPVLDAARRRQLPAWIREGLEKMEKEKLKRIEREKMLKEREELKKRRIEEDSKVVQLVKAQPMLPRKSRFDSDSDSSDHQSPKRSASPPVAVSTPRVAKVREPAVEVEPKTEEEKLQELMLMVRQTLTRILLEVTTEEVDDIAREVYSKFRVKAPAPQLKKSQDLMSLKGRLGLTGYSSGSDSESEAQQDGDEADVQDDSEEELAARYKRRVQEFSKIEREIEATLAEEEAKDKVARERVAEDSDDKQVESETDSKRLESSDEPAPEPDDPPANDVESSKSADSESDSESSSRDRRKKDRSHRRREKSSSRRRRSHSRDRERSRHSRSYKSDRRRRYKSRSRSRSRSTSRSRSRSRSRTHSRSSTYDRRKRHRRHRRSSSSRSSSPSRSHRRKRRSGSPHYSKKKSRHKR